MWDFLLGLFPTVVYNTGSKWTAYRILTEKKKKTHTMNQSKVTKYDKFLVKKKKKMNQSKVTKW